jgi:ATP-binding cassette subfamily B multidrug efflux pump
MIDRIFDWFEKRLEPYPPTEPTQPPKGLVAFCRFYTQGCWPILTVMAIGTAIIAVAEVYLFALLGNLVDWMSDLNRETFWQEEGMRLIGLALLVTIGLPTLIFLQRTLIHQTLLGNYPMRIRWNAHRYMLGQSYEFYQNEFAGRVATKVMQTALSVREGVMKVLDVMNYVGVYFLGILVLAASFSPLLLIPFVVWFIGYFALLRHFLPRLRQVSKRQADARSVMTGRVVDSYTNIATVKLFAHSEREMTYAKESMDGFLDTVYDQMRWVTKLSSLLYLANTLLLVAVAGLSIYLWLGAAVTIGMLAAATGLALRLNGMSQWIMWEIAGLFENIGMIEDGMSMLTQNRKVLDKPQAKALDVTEAEIVFDDVTFNYGKDHKTSAGVVEKLSLSIKPGEKVGLVGRSGAGKSTMVNLLLRFYDLEKGKITIDGQSVSDVTQESLRAAIGVVTQDTSLLHRSVRDNIIYGRPGATDEQMFAATEQAEAHEFILDLEDPHGRTGYDAHVGERGVKLSGGQRQRVAIARVILKDAPILLLDEATSALDSEVEAAIQSSLYGLMEGKTVIAIAHRLSTIAQLDRLIVLDKGEIVEQGTHDELVEAGGLYASLWNRQSGGFLAQIDETADATEAAE